MHFRVRQDAESWFKHVKDAKQMKTMFDRYYLCFVLGIASGRKSTPEEKCDKVSDIVDYFVTEYRPYQRLIIGLLVRAELTRCGIAVNEKTDVTNFLMEYVDPSSPTQMTDAAMVKMNEYASGGFDYLTEKITVQPYSIEDLLSMYVLLLKNTIAESQSWSSLKSK
jgi:hypothetical protein